MHAVNLGPTIGDIIILEDGQPPVKRDVYTLHHVFVMTPEELNCTAPAHFLC